jgi:bifunctional DNA-binding transcriptional regulator/antitoxin component of YhaV-PrlF toxin-antitoxin module
MGYESSVQVIERANRTRQFYLICPAPLAEALELEKGEVIAWIIEDKHTLIIKRSGQGRASEAVRGKRRG